MKFNYFTTKIPFLGVFSLVFLLASCGSYEYVGYDTDGIYGSDQNRTVETPPQQQEQTQVETKNDGTYYKNYFSEKARDYEYALEDGEIFTDIDSYEGDYNQEIDSLEYNKSYAGWGQNNSSVTINVIDRGWYNPWAWNSWYYSPRYSWGWNSWGWNVGYGYPYYGYGYGYGYPYYGYGYGYGYPYYGYGYGHHGYPYYNNYYGNYNRRSIAYSAGRRGSYLNRDISGISRANRSTSTSRFNSNSVRTRSSNQEYGNNRSTRTRTNTRSNTPRSNSTRATSPRRSSNTKASTPRRSSTPRASSSGSSSNNRSSGSVSRSSSSSSRSSGSRSSGSSSSSSRRN